VTARATFSITTTLSLPPGKRRGGELEANSWPVDGAQRDNEGVMARVRLATKRRFSDQERGQGGHLWRWRRARRVTSRMTGRVEVTDPKFRSSKRIVSKVLVLNPRTPIRASHCDLSATCWTPATHVWGPRVQGKKSGRQVPPRAYGVPSALIFIIRRSTRVGASDTAVFTVHLFLCNFFLMDKLRYNPFAPPWVVFHHARLLMWLHSSVPWSERCHNRQLARAVVSLSC